ncbi:MAG: hypothetical protein ABF915_07130, partial [Schleiferilactobacillus harbinensis]
MTVIILAAVLFTILLGYLGLHQQHPKWPKIAGLLLLLEAAFFLYLVFDPACLLTSWGGHGRFCPRPPRCP